MSRSRWGALLVLFGFIPVATGCVPSSLGINQGPSAYLNASKISSYSADRDSIIKALAKDSSLAPGDPNYYYNVTVAGFSYVDALCADYFNDLFVLERNRQAVKGGLNAFGQTTSAILAVTNASSLSMAIVVQAFGLATTMTDIVANTFLYRLPPATTLKFVRELQGAYRAGVFAGKSQITTKTQAFDKIQEYLSYCLPPVIEANLIEHVGATEAVAVVGGDDVKVVFGTSQNAQQRANNTVLTKVISPQDPVKRTPNPTNVITGAIGTLEKTISLSRGIKIQQAICVSNPNGDFGGEGSTTRAQLKSWGFGRFGTNSGNGIIDNAKELSELTRTVQFVGGTCKSKGFINAYEVGLIGSPDRLKDFAIKMKTILETDENKAVAEAFSVNIASLEEQSGIDSNFRSAVRATKKAVKLPSPDSTITPTLDSKISDKLDEL